MDSFREDEYEYRDFDARLLLRLLKFLKPYRAWVAFAVLLLLIVSGLELVGPILTKRAIDVNIAHKDIPGLITTVALFFILLIFGLGAQFVQTYLTQWVGQKAVYDLRVEVFSHLQKLSVSYFDRNPVGRLMTRVTSDVAVMDELFSAGVVTIFGDVFTITGIVTVMLLLNWRLALVTFLLLPLIFYISFIFRRYARKAFREVRLWVAKINTFLNENLSGMMVSHLFNLQGRNNLKFQTLQRGYLEANLTTIFYFAVFFPAVELVGSISIALIIGYGGNLILGGMLTLGGLVAFLQYSERFFRPIRDIAEKYNILQSAMASSERIFALLDTEPEVLPSKMPVKLSSIRGRIEFRNVTFGYDKAHQVLKNLSFTVEPGETLAVVGRTGAGKTTIINLLCRLYDPDEGEILIDGQNIQLFPPVELRRLIGLVQQELFLFSGSIMDNICLNIESRDYDKVKILAEAVQADKFIADMPQGYETKVGERGVTLSTGQRQLLSFARALAVDPKILVLDEATSSVDTETERLIQSAQKRLLQERTAIVIAHRLSTIRQADKIIVLHKGEIRECGTHEALLAQKGIYYRLYELQMGNKL